MEVQMVEQALKQRVVGELTRAQITSPWRVALLVCRLWGGVGRKKHMGVSDSGWAGLPPRAV